MFGTDIVLRNDCGCEIARFSVGQNEDPTAALIRVMQKDLWVLNEGDTIAIEGVWHEDEADANPIYCNMCGGAFTEDEFIEREGAEAFNEMASCGGYTFCPDCYEKTERRS